MSHGIFPKHHLLTYVVSHKIYIQKDDGIKYEEKKKVEANCHRKRESNFDFSCILFVRYLNSIFCLFSSAISFIIHNIAINSYNGNSLRCKDLKSLVLLCFDAWDRIYAYWKSICFKFFFSSSSSLFDICIGPHWYVHVLYCLYNVCIHRLSEQR